MNVIVLAAGGDGSFVSATQPYPKNLVEVAGEPLIAHALKPWVDVDLSRLVVCIRADEDQRWHTGDVVRLLDARAEVLTVPAETGGALCTALLAMDKVDAHAPLAVVNGDIVLDDPLDELLAAFEGYDGGIVTFEGVHPRWSFVRTDDSGLVVEAAEKRPISKQATAGLYVFAMASQFLEAASEHMLKAGDPQRPFYVCPVYNEYVLRGRRVTTRSVPRTSYFSLADPHGVALFEAAFTHSEGKHDAHEQAS